MSEEIERYFNRDLDCILDVWVRESVKADRDG